MGAFIRPEGYFDGTFRRVLYALLNPFTLLYAAALMLPAAVLALLAPDLALD